MLSGQDSRYLENQGALAKLRMLAVWINRSHQRRQKWKEVCHFLDLPDKFIEYDNDTRWNSTYRMLADGLQAEVQINKYLEHQVELPLPSFTDNDWERLRQIHTILSKFNELTLFCLTVPIYYELHDLLHDASERRGSFSKIDMDIAKYKKYYSIMDEIDTYYTALVLDPRVGTSFGRS
ncbi:hypothetical protein V1508DRAFT_423215 [Lipomyces doorenjongii]|uniref:uncharacterized protein n=1 Tax=Lipomyces doorenjongii TaxID=383834 RepID=UPI0034CD256E